MIGPITAGQGEDATAELLERLVAALEMKEGADSDSPAWVAEQEIRRLERQIMAEWRFHPHGDLARPTAEDAAASGLRVIDVMHASP